MDQIHTEWERFRDCISIRLYNWVKLNEIDQYIDTNKMCHLFDSPYKNSNVKCPWLGAIMGWVTFWKGKFSYEACYWEHNILERLMLVCGNSCWSKKQ